MTIGEPPSAAPADHNVASPKNTFTVLRVASVRCGIVTAKSPRPSRSKSITGARRSGSVVAAPGVEGMSAGTRSEVSVVPSTR